VATPAAPTRSGASRAVVWGPPLLVLALVIGAVYLLHYFAFTPKRRFMLPAPHEVFREAFLDSAVRRDLFAALGLSAQVAFTGLVIAIIVGFVLAVVMSQAKWLERSLFPYAVIIQTIPILAIVPLIGLYLDFGFTARVVVCVIIALFPIINNTLFGLQSADPGQHDLFTLHGASRWTRLVKLQLPAAMPAIFSGLRIAAGLSVIGAVVGDFFFKQGEPGIGILIDVYRARLQNPEMYAAVILASLLGVVVFWGFGLLSRLAVGRWHETGQRGTT
jgi:NitT/TauT family transport system permease protein